ncbi:MAG TPA: hypothetical protein IAC82_00680 [Candidatus Merdivicinus intestinigallinarum]|nr:hypothetical protein [Candidatus Merdivicinus intestinigallinarum]
MKAVVNGIYYDTLSAQPLSANCCSLGGILAEETAYQMPEGHYFIVRRVNGEEIALIPVSAEELLRWTRDRSQPADEPWPE